MPADTDPSQDELDQIFSDCEPINVYREFQDGKITAETAVVRLLVDLSTTLGSIGARLNEIFDEKPKVH